MRSASAVRPTRRVAAGVAFVGGLVWALAPAGLARVGGVTSVLAGLACAVIGEVTEWMREQDAIPRVLTTEQNARFFNFAGRTHKGDIRLSVSAGDSEATTFCDELAALLQLAGWQVDSRAVIGVPPFASRTGLTLRAPDVMMSGVTVLREAFREASIDLVTVHDPDCMVPELFVGPKQKTWT